MITVLRVIISNEHNWWKFFNYNQAHPGITETMLASFGTVMDRVIPCLVLQKEKRLVNFLIQVIKTVSATAFPNAVLTFIILIMKWKAINRGSACAQVCNSEDRLLIPHTMRIMNNRSRYPSSQIPNTDPTGSLERNPVDGWCSTVVNYGP